jgi:hypothetical protein
MKPTGKSRLAWLQRVVGRLEITRVWPFSKFAPPSANKATPDTNEPKPEDPPPPVQPQPEVTNEHFLCPRCRRDMILTVPEVAEHRYNCPYCHESGSLDEPPLPLPPIPSPAPEESDVTTADEIEQPEPASEWTVCSDCGVRLKSKNLYTHQLLHCCNSLKPSGSSGSSCGSSGHTSWSSDRSKPIPAHCTICDRWCDWPIYYKGLPYGSYCIKKVRGW